jgi:hypothetical protein
VPVTLPSRGCFTAGGTGLAATLSAGSTTAARQDKVRLLCAPAVRRSMPRVHPASPRENLARCWGTSSILGRCACGRGLHNTPWQCQRQCAREHWLCAPSSAISEDQTFPRAHLCPILQARNMLRMHWWDTVAVPLAPRELPKACGALIPHTTCFPNARLVPMPDIRLACTRCTWDKECLPLRCTTHQSSAKSALLSSAEGVHGK